MSDSGIPESPEGAPAWKVTPQVTLVFLGALLLLTAAALAQTSADEVRVVAAILACGLVALGAIGAMRPTHPSHLRMGPMALGLVMGGCLALAFNLVAGFSLVCLFLLGLPIHWLLEDSHDENSQTELDRLELERLSRERDDQIRKLLSTLDELERAGIQLTGTTTSLAATAREQEASIAEQAAAATQIMATSRQINATSRELANTMEDVAQSADEASQLANVGQDLLSRMQVTMDLVVAASSGIASKLSTLNERANKIGTVVVTIAKVADQTNLLSLNAAIEAEKAGEFGRGFGVVATEIRRLADQTAVATLDIEHMIREVLSAVSGGVMGMEKFTEDVRQSAETAHSVVEHLGQIIAQVQLMNERFEQVNFGMRSQAQGAEQITESMRQLSDATHHTAGSIKEFNQAIEALQQATQGLAATVLRGRSDHEALGSIAAEAPVA